MLWLVDSSIGEEGAVALTKVLHELKHLNKVGIVSCALGDRGTAAVAAALKQMHRLFHVSFRRNGIGDAGDLIFGQKGYKFAWLLPSRFTETGGPAVPENAALGSSSSSWLGWSRFSWTRSTARTIEADTTTPAPPASTVQPAQAPATSSLSWLFRSRSSEASPPAVQEPVPEASVEAGPVSSASSVTADSPSRQSSLSSSSGHASQAEPQQPSWRVWFSPGAGTAPQAPVDDAGSVEVLKEKRSSGSIAALAFTEAVALAPAQDAPFLKLELDLPEVVVEMQMDQRSQTIGSAELHVTLSAGEELSVCAEVAAMSLTVRRAEAIDTGVSAEWPHHKDVFHAFD
eukprot:s467_g7.t1